MELATGLTSAISEFAEREEEMAKERRAKNFAAKKGLDHGIEEEGESLEKAIAAADERSVEEKKH